MTRARLSGATTKKIRTDHEILTRENEKLVRKLDQVMREQQMQPGGKNPVVADDTYVEQNVKKKEFILHFDNKNSRFQSNPSNTRQVTKNLSQESSEDVFVVEFFFFFENLNSSSFRMNLVRRPSYASRYRNAREKYPGDTSPTRRTATIVRRVPNAAVVEGSLNNLFVFLFKLLFFSVRR